MHVTACIVGYQNNDDVVRCVEALGRSKYTNLSVMICENGGLEYQRTLVEALPETLPGGGLISVISAENPGYGGAFNLCVAASREANWWWLINPDCEPEPDALGALIARIEVGDCHAAGATLCLPTGRVQAFGGRFRSYSARSESIGHNALLNSIPERQIVEHKMNYILGASMLVGRHFMEVVGPMRHDYFLYAEEIEWCLRGAARGMRLGFAPTAIIHHNQGSTTGSGKTILDRPRLPIYLDERNKLHVVRDTKPWLLPIAFIGALLFIFARYTRRGAFKQTIFALEGWLAAWRNERGRPQK